MSKVKTWQERVLRDKNALPKREMQAEIDELRAKLAAREADIVDLCDQFSAKLDPALAKLAALESQPAAAEVLLVDGEKVIDASMAFFDSVELGTKLYLAAGAAPVQQEQPTSARVRCFNCGNDQTVEFSYAKSAPAKEQA